MTSTKFQNLMISTKIAIYFALVGFLLIGIFFFTYPDRDSFFSMEHSQRIATIKRLNLMYYLMIFSLIGSVVSILITAYKKFMDKPNQVTNISGHNINASGGGRVVTDQGAMDNSININNSSLQFSSKHEKALQETLKYIRESNLSNSSKKHAQLLLETIEREKNNPNSDFGKIKESIKDIVEIVEESKPLAKWIVGSVEFLKDAIMSDLPMS